LVHTPREGDIREIVYDAWKERLGVHLECLDVWRERWGGRYGSSRGRREVHNTPARLGRVRAYVSEATKHRDKPVVNFSRLGTAGQSVVHSEWRGR
jgi:hypothetical protein